MNKLFNKIAALTLGVAMAAGVGVAVGAAKASPVKADAATMTPGTNGSSAVVNGKDAVKVGTSSKGGDLKVTVPSGATSLSFYAAAWKGVNGLSLNATLSVGTADTVSFALTADEGLTNNSPFTLAGSEANYFFTTNLSGITSECDITFATSTTKRFVMWDAQYSTGTPATTYSVTSNIEHGSLNKTSVAEGATLVATVQPESGYLLPESVSVTVGGQASSAFTYSNGVVTIENVGGDVVISGTCPAAPKPEHAGTEADPYTVADARLAIETGSGVSAVYVVGIVSAITTPYSSQFGNISFDISEDGSTTASQVRAFRAKGSTAHPITSDADIEVGATVVVKGNLVKYNELYEIDSGCTVESYTAPVHEEPGINLTSSYHFFLADGDPVDIVVQPNEVFEGTPVVTLASQPKYVKVDIDGLNIKIAPVAKGMELLQIVATYGKQVAVASYIAVVDPISVGDAHTILNLVPTAILEGAYVEGIISQIDSFDSKHNSITYWISEDGTTENQFEVYSGKGLNGVDFTSKEDIEVGAHVVVHGAIKTYNDVHEFDKNNILISYVVPTPPTEKTLESISVDVTGAKTSYEVGEEFDATGIVVTAHYSDETTADVSTSAKYAGFDSSVAVAEQAITVSYLEGEVTKTTSFNVEIVGELPVKTDWTNEEKTAFAGRFEGIVPPFCPEINDFAWNEQYNAYILTPAGDISEAIAQAFADWTYEQGNYYSDFTEHGYVVLENYSGSYYLYWQQAAWFDEQIADFQEKLDGYVPTFNPALLDFIWNANLGCYTLGAFYDDSGYYQHYVGQELVSEDEFSAVEGAENVYYRYTANGTVYLACIIQQSGERTVFGAQLWYVKDPIPTSLQLDTSAVKLDYYVGQEFDPTGLVVNVLDENGEVMYNGQNIAEYCTFAYDFSQVGEATVTVYCAAIELGAEFTVNVAENPYGVEEWAEEFLAAIQNVCANYDGKANNKKALETVWSVMADKDHFGALSDEERSVLINTKADEKGDAVARALAFYDYACKKYGLSKFISGRSANAIVFEQEAPNSNRNALIAIAVVSFVAVTGIGLTIVIRRRKATNIK